MSSVAQAERGSPIWRRPVWLVAACAVLALGMVAAESVVALAILLMEGIAALVAVGLASGAGLWLVRFGRLAPDLRSARLIVGTGLGAGLISLLTLGLGSFGLLGRVTAFGLIIVLGVAGGAAFFLEIREARSAPHARLRRMHWFWLLAAPFLALAGAAASLPPGVLWKEEGFGYDVLEYHLAVPKIFMTDGRIHFLANNVYSNFPLNSEMLSLLMMELRGDAIEAAYMVVFANVLLAALFVASAWWAGSAFGCGAGFVSGVVAATTPWLVYLSGIAYVEPGMLATGMSSLALLIHALRSPGANWRWFACAGLLAGISCGFKYTAVPMIALALGAIILYGDCGLRISLRRSAAFGLSAMIAFSPWMIRNLVNTHNPVFPLAHSIFGSRPDAWSPQADAVWQRAHGSSAAEQNDAPVWERAVDRTLAEPLMGWSVLMLAAIGAVRHRDRWTLALASALAWQILFWLAFTHLFARFAVVMLLPLIVLAGRSVESSDSNQRAAIGGRPWHAGQLPMFLILLAGTATNLYHLVRLYYDHTRSDSQRMEVYGHTDWFVSGQWPGTQHWGAINSLPAGSRVMLVGEARTFYLLTPCDYAVVFNRHPLASAVKRSPEPADIMGWLRSEGFTHLLIHWSEMGRLERTYGFYRELNAQLFARLEAHGLRRAGDFALPGQPAYATLYEVPAR